MGGFKKKRLYPEIQGDMIKHSNGWTTKDSTGVKPAPKSATPAEKAAALGAYVERKAKEYNGVEHPTSVPPTKDEGFMLYGGLDSPYDAVESDLLHLMHNGKPITHKALLELRAAEGDKKAIAALEEVMDVEEDQLAKKEYHFEAMRLNANVQIEGDFDRNVSSVYEHQPHEAFAALSGERIETTVEAQQNNPFNGEDKKLRHYSPFTIALLPPKEVANLNSGSSTNKDPYSWNGLGNLMMKDHREKIMVTGEASADYFAGINGADSARLGQRTASARSLENMISELDMLVHNGQISTQTDHILQGYVKHNGGTKAPYTGPSETPLISVANVADIYMQMLQMFRTPPLLLLVNPTSMNVTYAKIQAHQERTRYGYVFQSWGEQLPVLNFSGRIGAFYGGESQGGRRRFMSLEETTHVSGVQEAARKVSPAFQNLMNLLKIYRNNGYIRDNVGKSQANHLIGMVEIAYDGVRYIGHFDKLEYTFEESNNLGGVNFSFDFTATEIRRNDDERHAYVMKMNNPNHGGRYQDSGEPQTMAGWLNSMERQGKDSGFWSAAAWGWENDFESENEEKDGPYQNSVLDSWGKQVAAKPSANKGETGWGTQGVQASPKTYTNPDDID